MPPMMYISMCHCFCNLQIIFVCAFLIVFKIVVFRIIFKFFCVMIGCNTFIQKKNLPVLVRSILGLLYFMLAASKASIIFSVEVKVDLQSGHFRYFGSASLHIFLRFEITFLLTKIKIFSELFQISMS